MVLNLCQVTWKAIVFGCMVWLESIVEGRAHLDLLELDDVGRLIYFPCTRMHILYGHLSVLQALLVMSNHLICVGLD